MHPLWLGAMFLIGYSIEKVACNSPTSISDFETETLTS